MLSSYNHLPVRSCYLVLFFMLIPNSPPNTMDETYAWVDKEREEIMINPKHCRTYSTESQGRGLVNIYAICSLKGRYSNFIFWSKTYSLRKWYLTGMCLVFECIIGFLNILMTLVLSQKIDMGCEQVTWICCRVWIIQSNCVHHFVAEMKSI